MHQPDSLRQLTLALRYVKIDLSYYVHPIAGGKETVVAPKGKKRVEIEEEVEDEVEDLDDLEDLEDLADEAEAEVEEDEEEDEDEAPRKKKSKGKTRARSTGRAEGTIGTQELADALDTDAKNLRVMLRDHNVEKNENKRYEWESVDDAIEAIGFESIEDAKDALSESRNKRLDALKERVGKNRAAEEPEEEDVEDDEEEDEEPAPRRSKKTSSASKKKTASRKR